MARRRRRSRGTPPVASRPPGARPVYIESVAGVGTTWYDRGPAYRRRRVGLCLAVLVGLGFQGWYVGIMLDLVYRASLAWFVVLSSLVGAFTVITGVYTWRRSSPKRAEAEVMAGRRRRSVSAADARRAGMWGAGIGTVARAGSVLGSAVLVVGSYLTLGLMAVLLIRSFGRELYAERAARAALNPPR